MGLELGSDDYVTKPYSPKELVLRVNNIIKRAYPEGETTTISYKNYIIETTPITKISIIGYGITGDKKVLLKVMNILDKYELNISYIDLTQSKIEVIVKGLNDEVIKELHDKLISFSKEEE